MPRAYVGLRPSYGPLDSRSVTDWSVAQGAHAVEQCAQRDIATASRLRRKLAYSFVAPKWSAC